MGHGAAPESHSRWPGATLVDPERTRIGSGRRLGPPRMLHIGRPLPSAVTARDRRQPHHALAMMTWIIAPILASLASMSSCGDGKRRSGATCAAQIPSRLTGSQSHVSTRRQSTVLNEAHRHKKRSPKRLPEMVVAATAQSLPASNPGVRQSAAYRSYSRFIDFQ